MEGKLPVSFLHFLAQTIKNQSRKFSGIWLDSVGSLLEAKWAGKSDDTILMGYATNPSVVTDMMQLLKVNVAGVPVSGGFLIEMRRRHGYSPEIRVLIHEQIRKNSEGRRIQVAPSFPPCEGGTGDGWCPFDHFLSRISPHRIRDPLKLCNAPHLLPSTLNNPLSALGKPKKSSSFKTSESRVSETFESEDDSLSDLAQTASVCKDPRRFYVPCGTVCPPGCGALTQRKCLKHCVNACYCRAPYLLLDPYNLTSPCILPEDCPPEEVGTIVGPEIIDQRFFSLHAGGSAPNPAGVRFIAPNLPSSVRTSSSAVVAPLPLKIALKPQPEPKQEEKQPQSEPEPKPEPRFISNLPESKPTTQPAALNRQGFAWYPTSVTNQTSQTKLNRGKTSEERKEKSTNQAEKESPFSVLEFQSGSVSAQPRIPTSIHLPTILTQNPEIQLPELARKLPGIKYFHFSGRGQRSFGQESESGSQSARAASFGGSTSLLGPELLLQPERNGQFHLSDLNKSTAQKAVDDEKRPLSSQLASGSEPESKDSKELEKQSESLDEVLAQFSASLFPGGQPIIWTSSESVTNTQHKGSSLKDGNTSGSRTHSDGHSAFSSSPSKKSDGITIRLPAATNSGFSWIDQINSDIQGSSFSVGSQSSQSVSSHSLSGSSSIQATPGIKSTPVTKTSPKLSSTVIETSPTVEKVQASKGETVLNKEGQEQFFEQLIALLEQQGQSFSPDDAPKLAAFAVSYFRNVSAAASQANSASSGSAASVNIGGASSLAKSDKKNSRGILPSNPLGSIQTNQFNTQPGSAASFYVRSGTDPTTDAIAAVANQQIAEAELIAQASAIVKQQQKASNPTPLLVSNPLPPSVLSPGQPASISSTVIRNSASSAQTAVKSGLKCQDPLKQYLSCGPACPQGCGIVAGNCNSGKCQPGCFCVAPLVLKDPKDGYSGCVPRSECRRVNLPSPRQSSGQQERRQPATGKALGRVAKPKVLLPIDFTHIALSPPGTRPTSLARISNKVPSTIQRTRSGVTNQRGRLPQPRSIPSTGAQNTIGCVDKYPRSCVVWTGQGRCLRNPGFMRNACSKSCKACGPLNSTLNKPVSNPHCRDRNRSCLLWAKRGDCNNNRRMMSILCQKSCGFCPLG